jgi:hypothetical protein|tara:strand:+ start:242 stop:448 length:207 start_codon:yes stop_codon:yes gene_type:complete
MIHYLVIGHGEFKDQEWRHMMFNDEQPDKYLEAKFIQRVREDSGWDEDKEIYVDFILKSNSIIDISYG